MLFLLPPESSSDHCNQLSLLDIFVRFSLSQCRFTQLVHSNHCCCQPLLWASFYHYYQFFSGKFFLMSCLSQHILSNLCCWKSGYVLRIVDLHITSILAITANMCSISYCRHLFQQDLPLIKFISVPLVSLSLAFPNRLFSNVRVFSVAYLQKFSLAILAIGSTSFTSSSFFFKKKKNSHNRMFK